ncbi:MAG: phage tail protein I [Novosphingobium sp.]
MATPAELAGRGLLPPNATALERAFDALVAERLGLIDAAYRAFWDPWACPVALLPWLAWAVSLDEWDPSWSELVRRAQIARAIETQRHKGTVAGVAAILAAFGGTVALREWWQQSPPGVPHTFDLSVALASTGTVPDPAFIEALVRAVASTKPLRSHFTFTLAQSGGAAIGTRAAGRAALLVPLRATAPVWSDPGYAAPANHLTLSGQPLTLGADYLLIGD